MAKTVSNKRGPGRSGLAPHASYIQQLLEKGMTYQEISLELREKFNVSRTASTIWNFVNARRKGYCPPSYEFLASDGPTAKGLKPPAAPATDSFAQAAEKMARNQAERERKVHPPIDPSNLVPIRPAA